MNPYNDDPGYIFSGFELITIEMGHYVENPARTAELEAQMPTFKGVPPSGAELYRGRHA